MTREPRRKMVRSVAASIFVLGLTAVLAEGAYRYFLKTTVAADVAEWTSKFKPSERPTFKVSGRAPWIYDRAVGHSFPLGSWISGEIKDGAFEACRPGGQGNRLGNYGWMPDDYATADLRVMI